MKKQSSPTITTRQIISTGSSTSPVSLVMIAYNEEKTIAKVLVEYFRDVFMKLPSGSEFIIYLDKPTDKTPIIVKKLAQRMPLKVVEGAINLKYAKALSQVLSLAKNELVFFSDSSGKHKAQDFWQLLPFADRFDIVNGQRIIRDDSFVRRIATKIQQQFVAWLFRIPALDYNSGFKIYHKRSLDYLLPVSQTVKFTRSTELLIRALHGGFKVKDVPVSFTGRKFKSSGTQLKQLLGMGLDSILGYLKIYRELK